MTSIEQSILGPPPPHVLETEIDGDISLYDPNTEAVLVLNGTASDIWRLCDGEQRLPEIVALLARAYGVEEAEIAPAVKETVERFVAEGFLSS